MFIIEIHGYSPKPPHGQSSPLALLSFSFLEKGKPGSHYYLGTSWAAYKEQIYDMGKIRKSMIIH